MQIIAGPSSPAPTEEAEDYDDDSDVEIVQETDQERRRAMLDATAQNDLDDLKSSRTDFSSDFIFPSGSPDSGEGPSCDVQVLPRPSATAASGVGSSSHKDTGKRVSSGSEAPPRALGEEVDTTPTTKTKANSRQKAKGDPAYGKLVQDEMKQRRLESLGLTTSTSGGRRLGGDRVGTAAAPTRTHTRPHAGGPASGTGRLTGPDQRRDEEGSGGWSCLVCTL